MSAPPVPPRPYELHQQRTDHGGPPPLPPLPADLRIQAEKYVTPSRYELETPAHLKLQAPPPPPAVSPLPLIAPRPTKMDKSVPVNMARRLDEQMQQQQQQQQQQLQQQKTINYTPGFILPSSQGGWQAPAPITTVDLATSIANLSIQPSAPFFQQPQQQNMQSLNLPAVTLTQSSSSSSSQASTSSSSTYPPTTTSSLTSISTSSSAAAQQGPPSLTAPLPSLAQLSAASAQIQQPSHDPLLRLAWARDVFLLLDRAQGSPTDPPIGPIHISDPTLSQLATSAVPLILQVAGSWAPAQGGKMPAHVAEAIFWRATCASTGAFPEYVRHNPRTAFRDFEAAARGGYAPAWFRLGRDYENFNDNTRAKECFERGAKLNVESCLYRLGMAHLLGQLSLPANASTALPYLHRAALLASLTCPQPAYVFSLLLLSEFTSIPPLPPSLLSPYIPPTSSPTLEARKHLERAAYLHFPAAQYKLGHAYEFAEPPFSFDPLLSVQYYSLASQQGEVEADMALSKWFLCGSGGAALSSSSGSSSSSAGGFEKDEALALTFAEKAARKGLPSAEFAMGYYAEVGVGQQRDIARALEWYRLAESHGNTDASSRLQALASPSSQALSRTEHESLTEAKLVRRRTMAAQRAELEPASPPWEGRVFPSMKVWEEGGGQQGQGQQQQQERQQQQPQSAVLRKKQDPRMVVDVIRKNSLAGGYPPVSVGAVDPASGGVAGVGAGGARMGHGQGLGQGQGVLQGGIRDQSPQRIGGGVGVGAGPRGDSPQRAGGPRGRYDSRVGAGAGTGTGSITPPYQYTQGGRGRESPGKRTQSPGRLGRLPISGSPSSSSVAGGRSSSPGAVGGSVPSGSPGQGQGQGKSKLERMRLNLDDPSPGASSSSSFPTSTSTSSSSLPTSTSTPLTGNINTAVPLVTPGVGGATPMTARPAGQSATKPQTFADMGIVGAKAEDKDCIIM